jgi:hypothetical protein
MTIRAPTGERCNKFVLFVGAISKGDIRKVQHFGARQNSFAFQSI